jgi:2-polyprenyl-3-methyl-5-hydroxy-6-metoxy-1,4-benzoquinol methylase
MIRKLNCPKCKKSTLKKIKKIFFCGVCNKNFGFMPIPNFVKKNYTNSFGYQWNIFSKTQLDSYSNLTVSKNRLFKVTKWNKNLSDNLILEVGSGSGRFTEILAKTNASIFTIDSSSAIFANYSNNSKFKNVSFIRSDINKMPFNFQFDKILCLGVLQHTKDIKTSLKNLKKFLKPDGELVFDIYKKQWYTFLQWKYLLRPFTKKIKKETLLNIIIFFSNFFYYPSLWTYKFIGIIYKNIYPIAYYHEIIKSKKLSIEWSILDTFDMYSPEYDTPIKKNDLKKILEDLGYVITSLGYGDNGIIAKVKNQ